jgi:von Willebrand factor type A domain/Aerotolerance regulator N-terminal
MGFLSLDAFSIGAALLVAVLATYLLKPSRPTRRVSSTFLWLAAFHEMQADRPWRRVPPSLLLLLQLLALGAIIAALARPFTLSADTSGLDAIVVLDTSASTQATDVPPSRFEAARQRVAQLVDALQPGETLSLIALGAEPRLGAPRTSDRAALHQALDTIQPTLQSVNLPAALSLAASLAEGRSDTQVIVVASGPLNRDLVPNGFPLALRYIGIGSSAENVAIDALGTRLLDGHLAGLARVANYGQQRHDVTLDLQVDGTRFDTRVLSIDPGGAADTEWDDLPPTTRVLEAHLAEPDALGVDNTAWAIVGGDRPARVLLVSSGNVFLERALGLRSGVQVTRTGPNAYLGEAQASPFDLVVFDGLLPADLPASGSVLLLHPPTGNPLLPTFQDVLVSRVEAVRDDHPLLVDVPLAGVHVSRARRVEVPAWADSVLESPETPLLLVGEPGGRRVAVLTFDVHDSDLPVQPAFPILAQHLLDWLVPTGSVATPVVRVGEATELVPLPEAQSVEVITPDGRQVQVAPPFPAPPFAETTLPGIYQVVQRDADGAETRSVFGANFAAPVESRLQAGENVAMAAGTAGTKRGTAAELLAPREIWQVAIIGALVLLVAEWWAFQKR